MKPIVAITLACAALLPLATRAQPVPAPTNPRAIEVLKRADVVRGQITLRGLTDARLRGLRSLGFTDGGACTAPLPISTTDIDVHRTLFVHDDATLNAADFSLRHTLTKLSNDVIASVPGTTPETIFRQLWDTQNASASSVTPNAHCDDNNGTVNGYPLNKCPRPEGAEAVGTAAVIDARIDNDYKPIALVNRIDLADKGWKNCGEHRVIYGKGAGAKNIIIFEAVLPNPKPGCRSGCRDVIDFWLDLSDDPSPASRATKLEAFYYTGLPGFQPVVKTTHYTSGTSSVYGGSSSGQIRTNQFLAGGPWTLKEFKTLLSCSGPTCDYDLMPTSVKVNPYGVLWNKDVATGTVPGLPPGNPFATAIPGVQTLAANFQSEVLAQVTLTKLANPDLGSFTFEVKPDKNAAESQSQSPVFDNYLTQFNAAANAGFRTDMDSAGSPFGLSGVQLVNRALTQSCAGCHLPGGFGLTSPNSVGPAQSWPDALAFVHVDPPITTIAADPGFDLAVFGGNTQGFRLSPALHTAFLPARRVNLTNLANDTVCDCVPNPDKLTRDKLQIPKQKAILERFTRSIKGDLAAADKRFASQPAIKRGDERILLREKKEIIAKAEVTRNRELSAVALDAPPEAPKVEAVKLSSQRLAPAELRKVKTAKMNELVNAEPPRETITGSFRSH